MTDEADQIKRVRDRIADSLHTQFATKVFRIIDGHGGSLPIDAFIRDLANNITQAIVFEITMSDPAAVRDQSKLAKVRAPKRYAELRKTHTGPEAAAIALAEADRSHPFEASHTSGLEHTCMWCGARTQDEEHHQSTLDLSTSAEGVKAT